MANYMQYFNTMDSALQRMQRDLRIPKITGIKTVSIEAYRNAGTIVRFTVENNIIAVKAFGRDAIIDITNESYEWTGSAVGAFRLTAEIAVNWEAIKHEISKVVISERKALEIQLASCSNEMRILTNFAKEKYDAKV
jgi:hypothetical protein